mgnify:CR=1 FL=1
MRLNDPLTTSIFFEEKEYPIDLSFDNVLDVLEVLRRKDILMTNKVEIIIYLLIGENELNLDQSIRLWDIVRKNHIEIGMEKPKKYDIKGNLVPEVEEEKSEKVIDLVADAKYIYASFRQIGINLFHEQGKMQWEEFQALLEALPDDTIMQRIIQIRLWKPTKGESSQYKEQMCKAQNRYRLVGGEE